MTKRRRTDRASARQIGSPRSRPSKFVDNVMRLRLWLNFTVISKELCRHCTRSKRKLTRTGLRRTKRPFQELLETETAKFQGLYEKFCKDQANHLQALKGKIKKESDDEKACTDKIAKLEESLKKKKQNFQLSEKDSWLIYEEPCLYMGETSFPSSGSTPKNLYVLHTKSSPRHAKHDGMLEYSIVRLTIRVLPYVARRRTWVHGYGYSNKVGPTFARCRTDTEFIADSKEKSKAGPITQVIYHSQQRISIHQKDHIQ
ncbi:hypothetical protein Prudu_000729, partial [Prunus dulcis]